MEDKFVEIKQDRNAHHDELMDAKKLRKNAGGYVLTSEYQKREIKTQEDKKRMGGAL